jgi:nicotinamide-nucleotide amidase
MPQNLRQRAFVVSQGEELLTGLTLDTNAHFLAGRLTDLGFRVCGAVTAGDRIEAIARALLHAVAEGDVVICTGGLGPTGDDLTAEAAAEAFDRPLGLVEEALAQVEERYRSAGRAMAGSNRRQAILPAGSTVVPNRVGTAPGFALEAGDARLWFLPGVPSEMRVMWAEQVEPAIRSTLPVAPPLRHLFRVMGKGESQLQDALGDVPERFGGVELGFQARMPENLVKLTADAGLDGSVWEAAVLEVRRLLGKDLFSEREETSLAARVGELLVARGEKLALAESCTGGQVAHLCVTEAGSSAWLERGFVTYSNEAKAGELGVAEATLEEHGAVSQQTAAEMAAGAREAAGVAWGVSTTGVAGPSGGTNDKPVGTVCFGVHGPAGARTKRLWIPARDRSSVRRFSSYVALDLLRRQLERLG